MTPGSARRNWITHFHASMMTYSTEVTIMLTATRSWTAGHWTVRDAKRLFRVEHRPSGMRIDDGFGRRVSCDSSTGREVAEAISRLAR